MSVPIQSIEESLSVSYVSAIVAKSGFSFNIVDRDYGVDVSIRKIDKFNNQIMDMGVIYDCQLKSTINWKKEDNSIVYDVEADTYNKLIYRYKNHSTPCFLVLLCLPKQKEEWLKISENELNLRKCCYYYYINGNYTDNKSSIRLRIPRENLFSPETVSELIEKVRAGDIK